MIDNKDCVQLCRDCFDVCETLKNAIRGATAGGLDQSSKVAVENLERCATQP